MKRILMVLAVAALMAMMLVAMAAPAMAKGSGGVVRIDTFNDRLTTSPKSTLLTDKSNATSRQVNLFPGDPIHPGDPISPLNPNVIAD